MKVRTAIIWLAWFILSTIGAWADGGFTSSSPIAQVTIPDQRALIIYSNGVETLIIDTSFQGEGNHFAWIVPVPSRPKVSATTAGVFPTLAVMFSPGFVSDGWCVIPWIAAVILFLVVLSIWLERIGGSSLLKIGLVVFLVSILLCFLCLPAVVTAQSGSMESTVQVVDRKVIGNYDTVTLEGKDGSALIQWLQTNQFYFRPDWRPAIEAYAKEGWYFVASRLRTSISKSIVASPHPLALTFQTERPVYPLRLTGGGNDSCEIDLYVFGFQRAQMAGFKVDWCASLVGNGNRNGISEKTSIGVWHPILQDLVRGCSYVTKLSGKLTSLDMAQDAYVQWVPFQYAANLRFSKTQALSFCAAVSFLLVSLFWFLTMLGSDSAIVLRILRWSRNGVLIALVGIPLVYMVLPKTEVIKNGMPRRYLLSHHFGMASYLSIAGEGFYKKSDQNQAPQYAEFARKNIEEGTAVLKEIEKDGVNPITGQPYREEDSPGNYILRESSNAVDYLFYDWLGRERIVHLYPKFFIEK